jgi:hypothetical protein
VISTDLIHNHPEEENIERQALSNAVKRKALDNLTHKPAKLLRQELRQNVFFGSDFHLWRGSCAEESVASQKICPTSSPKNST